MGEMRSVVVWVILRFPLVCVSLSDSVSSVAIQETLQCSPEPPPSCLLVESELIMATLLASTRVLHRCTRLGGRIHTGTVPALVYMYSGTFE